MIKIPEFFPRKAYVIGCEQGTRSNDKFKWTSDPPGLRPGLNRGWLQAGSPATGPLKAPYRYTGKSNRFYSVSEDTVYTAETLSCNNVFL